MISELVSELVWELVSELILKLIGDPDGCPLTDIGYECTFECDSCTDAEGMDPTVYVFTNNNIPNIQNSGS